MSKYNVEDMAKVCHEVNRAYCEFIGDPSCSWEDAPKWQIQSAIKGVEFHMKNPDATPADSHESWLAEKKLEGWKYGAVKDAEKKEHPCYVSYNELPQEQQLKDYLFQAVLTAML